MSVLDVKGEFAEVMDVRPANGMGFSKLTVGQYFEFDGKLWVKIASYNESPNAITCGYGSLDTLGGDYLVSPCKVLISVQE